MSRLINRPCSLTFVTGEAIDDFDAEDQARETDSIETVCELQQSQRTEPAGEAETSRTDWDIYFPGSVDPAKVVSSSTVLIHDEGLRYELIGDGWAARSPRTGRISHIEASARRAGTDPPEEEGS